MIETIIAAIAIKLNALFGDGYEIYQSNVRQGLNEPCFFILVLQPERRPLPGNRSIQTLPFDIHYFPTEDGGNSELYTVADRLTEEMEFITAENGDMFRGTGRKWQIMDGVLHFFVNYDMILIRTEEKTVMEAMENEPTLKG